MTEKITKPAAESADTTTSYPVPSTLIDSLPLPKFIVFDLDYTLWPFWADCHITPPLRATTTDCAKDRTGETFKFYDEVPSILLALRERGIKIGIASRTSTPDLCKELLKILHIVDADGKKKKAHDYCNWLEMYPASKIQHFTRLQRSSEIRYEDMLFFDDESRNRDVESLGVLMYLVSLLRMDCYVSLPGATWD